MQYSQNIHTSRLEPLKPLTKKHKEIISTLEKMLEKGIPELTMSELASRLKISLRTLYEIAPSKDQLITMTVDNILKKLGKSALEQVSKIESPIDKLDTYLGIVNQAVGPKFDAYIKGLGKIDGSCEMIDYHEDFITKYTEKLLVEAMNTKEIQKIDPKAFAILLGGIGREFAKNKNRSSINESPEKSANSVTRVILKGIRLEN
jgi:AcrR family transcriptional regulator